MGLLSYLLLTGAWPFVLAVLVAVFLLVRVRQGADLGLASGATAYTSIVLATVAVVAATGVARLLAGAMGAIDADFTYGPGGLSGNLFGTSLYTSQDGSPVDPERNNFDFAAGLALVMMAIAFGWFHLGLRMRLDGRGLLDRSVERAVEVVVTVVAGVVTAVLASRAFSQVLQRAMVDSRAPSPGETIAAACGALLVLLLYGSRVAQGLGIGPAWLRPGGISADAAGDEGRS